MHGRLISILRSRFRVRDLSSERDVPCTERRGRSAGQALAPVALSVVLLGVLGPGQEGDGPTTTAPSTTAPAESDWRATQHEAVVDAREALWLDGRPAPAPPVRLEVESVAFEEIDGAQVALLRTCIVSEQGDTFDIFGGIVERGSGYTTNQSGEVMGTVEGRWQLATRLVTQARSWEGEAGCATD